MIPDYQTAMLPLLAKMSDEKIYDPAMLRDIAISFFKITDAEKAERTPNGKQFLYQNRISVRKRK